MPTHTYAGNPVEIRYNPLVLFPSPPRTKAVARMRKLDALYEVRHAVNTWLYSQ